MSQALASLPRSESKARFFSRLHLDLRDARHRQIYNLMKDEASEGRARILAVLGIDDHGQIHSNGTSPGAGGPSITTSQVPEYIMNSEISYIYHHAGPATKILYELAFDPDHPHEPNWIIRWMLWHVFRYRDGRQARGDALPRHHLAETPSSEDDDVPATQRQARAAVVSSGINASNDQRRVAADRRYDPVRDRWNS